MTGNKNSKIILRKANAVLLIMSILVLCFGSYCHAENDNPDFSDIDGAFKVEFFMDNDPVLVKISGKESNLSYRMVSLQVLDVSKTVNDLNTSSPDFSLKNTLVHYAESMTDLEGAYSFTYKQKGVTGKYTVRIAFEGGNSVQYQEYNFYSLQDIKSALDKFNEVNIDASKMKDYILSDGHIIKADKTVYNSFSEAGKLNVCSILYEKRKVKPNNMFSGVDDFLESFYNAVKMQVLNEAGSPGQVKEILFTKYTDYFKISTALTFKTYSIMTEPAKTEVLAAIGKADHFFEPVDIYNVFNNQTILSAIFHIPLWTEVKGILKDYNSILNLDFTEYDNPAIAIVVDKALANKEYASIDKLKEAFYAAIGLAKAPPKTNPPPGGSAPVKSSGGGVIPKVDLPVTAPVENAKFNDIEDVPWAIESINQLAKKGIVSGKGGNTFEPNSLITKEEYVKLLIAGFKLTDENSEADFNDTNKNEWYYQYIATAV